AALWEARSLCFSLPPVRLFSASRSAVRLEEAMGSNHRGREKRRGSGDLRATQPDVPTTLGCVSEKLFRGKVQLRSGQRSGPLSTYRCGKTGGKISGGPRHGRIFEFFFLCARDLGAVEALTSFAGN